LQCCCRRDAQLHIANFIGLRERLLALRAWYVEQGRCNGRVSVRPSVCPVIQLQRWRAAGLLLSAVRAAAALQNDTFSTALSSKCGLCHVDSGRRKLHVDSFASCGYGLDALSEWHQTVRWFRCISAAGVPNVHTYTRYFFIASCWECLPVHFISKWIRDNDSPRDICSRHYRAGPVHSRECKILIWCLSVCLFNCLSILLLTAMQLLRHKLQVTHQGQHQRRSRPAYVTALLSEGRCTC